MKTILDIGCNNLDGYKTLKSYETIDEEDVKIFVEANPECWSDLERDIKYIKNSFLIKKAIDIEKRKVKLLTRSDKLKDVAATIMGEEFLLDSLNRWHIKINNYHSYDIETISIIDIIEEYKIDTSNCILKFDAEGVEYKVLNQILQNNIIFKKIYCEFHVHSEEDEIEKEAIIKKFKKLKQEVIEWH